MRRNIGSEADIIVVVGTLTSLETSLPYQLGKVSRCRSMDKKKKKKKKKKEKE